MKTVLKKLKLMSICIVLAFTIQSCGQKEKELEDQTKNKAIVVDEKPEYFLLRPQVEKTYGYSHAVKIGNTIKISGAVSFDDQGKPTAKGDLAQQMKNCYADLDKILKHYDCTFDDVIMENIFTTNMPLFLEVSGYRKEIYKKNFPTGSWLGVKALAFPELMIEIELEVYKPQ
ncbi:RidA family protein [Flavobacterium sp. ANB]|uniref:RidA family protein n=1 Tax=unclassified Flavobacterium TaxID=196869 RepID=UPI0012BA09D1|nr:MULTISPECIES: RidA family protein [unclassified Flavobacterium]MBF4519466.1 RidA family protein [Flavobacterium sp. ANB]MTD72544.1 RidA family protein [Flavobacterium sp. LC2016-13]